MHTFHTFEHDAQFDVVNMTSGRKQFAIYMYMKCECVQCNPNMLKATAAVMPQKVRNPVVNDTFLGNATDVDNFEIESE